MNHDNDFSLPMMRSAFFEPEHLSSPAPWAGHIPFAAWLMATLRPRTLVELGVYSGISYLAFCQAAVANQVPVRMWGVDAWQGDVHGGLYDGTRILQTLRERHDTLYGHFSTLLQKTFDEAIADIADGSVDLLHIDGLHTYEAVRHDFETWQSKLSERAVVLFHDIAVHERDFGVWRYWEELTQRFPAFSFAHSNGLGVLLVGDKVPEALQVLAQDAKCREQAQYFFRALGERFELRAKHLHLDVVTADLQEKSHLLEQRVVTLSDANTDAHEQSNHAYEQLYDVMRDMDNVTRQLQEAHAQSRAWQDQVESMLDSRSWRMTAGLRWFGQGARQVRTAIKGQSLGTLLRRVRRALGYIVTGNWRELAQRLRYLRKQSTHIHRLNHFVGSGTLHCGILSTPHTWFVAHGIVEALSRAGFSVQFVEESKHYPLDLYFVICPQMFRHMPPGEKRIVFQMEQSVSTRWFTPDYIATLENSLAVLDYSQINIRKLAEYGIVFPHIYFAPIGGIANYAEAELSDVVDDEVCDVLFYGDANVSRRRRLLDAIGKHFKLRVISNVFGAKMHRAIAGAKVVVNLHYYEDALLETTRIYECLSLGKSVVSEVSADQNEHGELEGVVRFVPLNDKQALIAALREAIAEQENVEEREEYNKRCQAVVASSQERFAFMLYRLLLAQRIVDYNDFTKLIPSERQLAPRMALSLPELIVRRNAFAAVRPADVTIFDGLRYSPGWMGAALSYKYLAQCALQQGLPRLEILEDDVEFPPDYDVRRAQVNAWLDAHEGEWDTFVGLMALVHPDTKILRVERVGGQTFVMLDRMISMVGNIYAPSALQRIAQWDETIQDADSNTIDRFLQMQGEMRVVITLPFLLGHREDMDSSLWGFSNVRYAQLIADAQRCLEQMVADFERRTA
ncbi:MAG: class I SAM-dependent methyltransferase [Cardiobacteriaceae bacterium]|nr:class I SAM-dependent methyltransferase [Cardiobacteriaceae bacterium]